MRSRALLLAVPLAVIAAGCGADDDDPTLGAASDGTTTTVATVELPERIVSISPTSTEVLFAIGAGDLVVAVDDQSDYPAGVPTTDLSSYEPNVEAIAGYEPDLVVSSSDDPALVDGLEALDIDVLVHEAAVAIQDVYDQIAELGEVTGHADEATALVEEMTAEIAGIASAAEGRERLTAYWELDPTYYSVTSATFIGKLLDLANVTSIADEAQAEADDYPQLSAEYIIAADPDLIVLADTECCQQSAATIAARPGWESLEAVSAGHVVEMSDDVASRWGPRIVELLQQVDAAAEKAAA